MSFFDGLDEEDMAAWRESPITEHLLGRLTASHASLVVSLEAKAATGSPEAAALGGKCMQLRELIRAIKGDAK